MIEKKNFYINGKWVAPVKPNDFEVIDPSTEDAFAVISLGSIEDTDKAVSTLTEFSYLIRKALSKKLDIKFLPKLHFVGDGSFDYAEKIEKLIKENSKK